MNNVRDAFEALKSIKELGTIIDLPYKKGAMIVGKTQYCGLVRLVQADLILSQK